ncbi:MAG: cation:proton antiporter subunit C [Spirochaetes bacterium]|nr:cation:proton antiporter subunit C [Spirochaetota bacterium]
MEIFGVRPVEIFPIFLFLISIFGMITTNNIVKSIVYTLVLTGSVIAFWIALGSRAGFIPPILETDYHLDLHFYEFADPVPQALMITSIIIGFCVTAINIIMLNTLHKRYKTTDWETMYNMAREEVMKDKDKTLSDIVYEDSKKDLEV